MSEIVNKLTVQDLYTNHKERFGLEWIAGQHGGNRTIIPEGKRDDIGTKAGDDLGTLKKSKSGGKSGPISHSLVGYLNLIHPHQIQVMGDMELKYFESLRDISRQDAIRQLYSHSPACIIVAENRSIPTFLKRKCNENTIPLFSSPLPSNKLTDSLHYYLANLFADVLTLHGVFMEVNALGVLITGPSGVGKSELALELITRGHRLIADDAPQFSRIAPVHPHYRIFWKSVGLASLMCVNYSAIAHLKPTNIYVLLSACNHWTGTSSNKWTGLKAVTALNGFWNWRFQRLHYLSPPVAIWPYCWNVLPVIICYV